MARVVDALPLDAGATFPEIAFVTTDAATVDLPRRGRWTVVVFYRGEW